MADWHRQLRGAFAFDSAPFASHPTDERFACGAIANAVRFGASKSEIETEIYRYLRSRGVAPNYIEIQVRYFRIYFSSKYSSIKNCWILSKSINESQEFISIFSGRKSVDDILCHCMYIYESKEFNHATQFMRAKKKRWPTFSIEFHRFESGGLWEGKASIGSNPTYTLEKGDAVLSKALDPSSIVVWKAKPIPEDPGPTWSGLRYKETYQKR